jgi:hypothetical protein
VCSSSEAVPSIASCFEAPDLHSLAHVIREVSLTRAAATTVTDADELFVNLDGSVFETPQGRWSVEVCGIHSDDDGNWVQLCLRSDTSYGLTVSVDQLSAVQVRSAVSRWLSSAPR